MYLLLEIRNNAVISKQPVTAECFRTIMDGLEATSIIRKIQEDFMYFHEALKELEDWCLRAPQDSEYLMRNLHTAERLCRGVLFEYRTFLDHTEKLLKKNFGKESDAAKIFKQGTHDAYEKSSEYAVTYRLRNSMQHFDSIVHSFAAPVKKPYLQPCADPQKLLLDPDWKEGERDYLLAIKGNLDLYTTFVATYEAMGNVLTPVMNYLLKRNDGGANIMMIRNWIEPLFKHEDSKFFYLAEEDETGNITAFPVYWGVIYKLGDSLNKCQ